jgi:hypothetical protein
VAKGIWQSEVGWIVVADEGRGERGPGGAEEATIGQSRQLVGLRMSFLSLSLCHGPPTAASHSFLQRTEKQTKTIHNAPNCSPPTAVEQKECGEAGLSIDS